MISFRAWRFWSPGESHLNWSNGIYRSDEVSRFHVKLQSFQITNLLYLMRSTCVSLGFSESQEAMNNQEHDSTSLEQKRAFTGVYYLVTMFVP